MTPRLTTRLVACRAGALTVACCLAVLGLAGCGPATLVIGASPGDNQLVATVVEDDGRWFSDRVAIIDVTGVIYNADRPGLLRAGENPVSLLHERLAIAEHDHRVKAVILRLNTPGGGVTASDTMYRMVRRFRERTGKPVIALIMDVAASGGYYLACAADRIVAYPTSITGSVGVIVQTVSVKPALDRFGIRAETFASGPNKDTASPLSTMNDEQRQILQTLVDQFHQRFVEVVRDARPGIKPEQFTNLTDGRVLSGDQAVQAGLLDQLGGLDEAFDLALRVSGLKNADLVIYHRRLEYVGSPYALTAPAQPTSRSFTQINLAQFNVEGSLGGLPVGFYYLWGPMIP